MLRRLQRSTKIYFGLVLLLAVLSAISVYLPQGDLVPQQQLPASKPVLAVVNFLIMLFIYGGLGYIGLRLARKVGFAAVWEQENFIKERLITPALIGAGNGVVFIIVDLIFSQFNSVGLLPHPPFPTSLVASATAGISEEIIFRLFFISVWVWLISHVLLKKKWQPQIFWVVAVVSGIAFAAAHLPSVMFVVGIKSINNLPLALIVELLIINGTLSLFAAHYFRKYGFLAAVGIHFWADIVWHVAWGLV